MTAGCFTVAADCMYAGPVLVTLQLVVFVVPNRAGWLKVPVSAQSAHLWPDKSHQAVVGLQVCACKGQ